MRSRLKSALNNFNNEERGAVLISVLVMLLLGSVLLIPQLQLLVGTNIVSGGMYQGKSQELYAADSGAMDALWLLAQHDEEEMVALIQSEEDGDPTKHIYDLPETVDNKTVHCEIRVYPDEGYIINSTATAPDGSSTTVEVWAIHPEDHPTLKFSTGSLNGDLRISSNLGTELEPVNLYADGNIGIQGSAVVYGNAYYTPGHTLTVGSNATFTGVGVTTRPLQVAEGYLPDISDETQWELWDDDMTIKGTELLGNLHITGNLSISGGATLVLSGPVWVDGTISSNASNIVITGETPEDYHFLVSDCPTGTAISLQGGTIKAILYTTQSDIYLAGNVDLDGAAVGYGDIDVMGTATLFNAVPLEEVPISFYPMSVLYWKIY